MSRAYDTATLAQSLLAPVARCLDAALADMGFELAAEEPRPGPDLTASPRPEPRAIEQAAVPVVKPHAGAPAHVPDAGITVTPAPESPVAPARDSMHGSAHVTRPDEGAGTRPRLRLRSSDARARELGHGAPVAGPVAMPVRWTENSVAPAPVVARVPAVDQPPHGAEHEPAAPPAPLDRRRPEHRSAAPGSAPARSPEPAVAHAAHSASTASERAGSALDGTPSMVPRTASGAPGAVPAGEHELAALLARRMSAAPAMPAQGRGAEPDQNRLRLRPRSSTPEASDNRSEAIAAMELVARSPAIAAPSTRVVRGAQRVRAGHAVSSAMTAQSAPGAAFEAAGGTPAAFARPAEPAHPPVRDALADGASGNQIRHDRTTHPQGHVSIAPRPRSAAEPPPPSFEPPAPAAEPPAPSFELPAPALEPSLSSPGATGAPGPAPAAPRIAHVASPAQLPAAWPATPTPAHGAMTTTHARQGAHTVTAESKPDPRPLITDPLDPTLERALAAVLRNAARRQGIDV